MSVLKQIMQASRLAFISLKYKIILLTSISVLLSTILVAGIDYFRIEKIVFETSVEKLAGETRLMAQRFKASYDQMKSDVQVLSQTPPIQGIIRSTAGAGIDALDGSTTLVWRERLGTIFSSMVAARPHYAQLRYIGVADDGRELVRINRTSAGIHFVPEKKLQNKRQEPYFQAGLQTQENDIHFSEVTYNRENNALDAALVPTVRTVMPIFDHDGKMFGMIVINANYADLLRTALTEIAPRYQTFVVNSAGDYMAYAKDGTIGNLEFHDHYSVPHPRFVDDILSTRSQEETFVADGSVSYFVRLNIDPNNPDAFLGVVVSVPYKELIASVLEARAFSVVLGVLLVLICLVASIIIASKFIAPLDKMTNQIKFSKNNKDLENLPLDREDEIGDLARAFDKTTKELATNEAKLVAIVDNTVDGLITFDQHGAVETYNRACRKIFGYHSNEIIGQNVEMLMPNLFLDEQETSLRSIVGHECEVMGRRKNKTTFPLEVSLSEVNIDDRMIYSGIVRDITERKQMEIMKNEFISTVNHELRTPLTSIQGSLGLLMAMCGDVDEKGKRLLHIAHDNCQRLTRLVNDILDIEKIAAGKMEYHLQDVDICPLVREIVDQQLSYADKFGVELIIRFAAAEIWVKLDQDRFNQALVNLLSNAIKFSDSGNKVEVDVSINAQTQAVISVRDYGLGIPKDFRDRVFDKFSQADSSATRSQDGTGLGLNITKKIIEAFGGTVDFETEEGLGSTFTFALPTCQSKRMRA